MPRAPYRYAIARGSAPPRKVRRWLSALGVNDERYVTPEMRQRHVHPRHLRHAQSAQPTSAPEPVVKLTADPFAALRGLK